MKRFLSDISPFNNRTDMPILQFVIKKVLAFGLCYILGLLIAEAAVIILHFAFGKNMLVGEIFEPQTITLIKYYGYIIIIAVTVVYWKLIEKKPLAEMGITKRVGSYFIGAAEAVLLLLVIVIILLLLRVFVYHGIYKEVNIPLIGLFTGGFMVQGAMEEFLCRGLVLQALRGRVSDFIAVAVSTVLFIVPHLSGLLSGEIIYGLIGIANLIFVSVIFSLLTLKNKSIWAACGLHSVWNAIIYSILGLNLSGKTGAVTAIFELHSTGENIWNGGVYGIEASAVTVVVLGAFAVMLLGAYRKNMSGEKNCVAGAASDK